MIIRPVIALLLWLNALCVLTKAEFNTSECGRVKACVEFPVGCTSQSTCNFLFSHQPAAAAGDDNGGAAAVEMELYVGREDGPDTTYAAFGFSDDPQMGDEPVIGCALNKKNELTPIVSRNYGKSNRVLAKNSASNGVTAVFDLLSTQVTESGIYCRLKANFQKATFDASFRPDPSKQYYILGARGAGDESELQYHSSFFVANRQMRLADNTVVTTTPRPPPSLMPETMENAEAERGDVSPPSTLTTTASQPPVIIVQKAPEPLFNLKATTRYFLMKLHGFLMLAAWMFCVTAAIFSARYLRDAWSTSTIGGLKVWFQMHRTLNALGLVLFATASLLIFVAKDMTWTGPRPSRSDNFNAGAVHSLVGAISVLIGVAQPLNALLRCSPGHVKRPVFNAVHRLAGLIAVVLAFVAVFIAILKFEGLWRGPSVALLILCAFVAITLAIVVVNELTKVRAQRRGTISVAEATGATYYEMKQHGGSNGSSSSRFHSTPMSGMNNGRTTVADPFADGREKITVVDSKALKCHKWLFFAMLLNSSITVALLGFLIFT